MKARGRRPGPRRLTTRPSASTRSWPGRTSTAASPGATGWSGPRPWRTSTRRSGWSPGTHTPITTAASSCSRPAAAGRPTRRRPCWTSRAGAGTCRRTPCCWATSPPGGTASRTGPAACSTRRRRSATHREWPYPIIKHLRGELDEAGLLAAAVDDGKRAEAHCFLGLEALADGREDAAIAHFRWVKERGDRRLAQYVMSVAELDRLLARGAEGDGP